MDLIGSLLADSWSGAFIRATDQIKGLALIKITKLAIEKYHFCSPPPPSTNSESEEICNTNYIIVLRIAKTIIISKNICLNLRKKDTDYRN